MYFLLYVAALAAAEGVIRSAREVDIGAIFGIGYPPFRGGPLRYMDTLGAAEVVRTLESLGLAHGPRFTPAPVLVDCARTGESFYSE